MGGLASISGGYAGVIAGLVFGYLLGSIPFGLVLTRLAGLGDVREIGSGNIGATNVLRTGNKGLAAATLLLDAAKGTTAVLAGAAVGPLVALAAGFGAFAGHCFPVWLRFKGGKGVATFLGVLLGLSWQAAIVFAAVWLAVAVITRYSSLSALLALAASPAFLAYRGDLNGAAVVAVMAALSWYRHRDNISRLLAGTESRIGSKG